jgi:hypothetical protein
MNVRRNVQKVYFTLQQERRRQHNPQTGIHFILTAMRNALFKTVLLAGSLSLGLIATASHAEIYKWVDANGRTHFSERKDDAGKAQAVDVKAAPQPAATSANTSSPEYWQEQERQFRQRQIQNQSEKQQETTATKPPKSLSGGREDGTDASRCNLAKDILSGAVKHSSGKPIDQYDREVAENDVRRYCK